MSTGLQCYVDADFAGAFDKTVSDDHKCAHSKRGNIIKYANYPILWMSTLQSEISLSTEESEHIALSTALRNVTPIKLIEEILEAFKLKHTKK